MKPKLNLEHLKELHPNDVRKALVIAIIYRKTKVVSYGFNRKIVAYRKFTKHAEEDAIRKAGSRTKGCDILIIRIKKDSTFGNAKPCHNCQILIDKAGINRRDWT